MTPEKYSMPLSIPSYMTDRNLALRPSSFMQYAEQMAMIGALGLGFDDKSISPYGVVWILARMHFRYVRTPHREDNVVMRTWHKGVRGLFFVRDYCMSSPDGDALVEATSSWILMRVATRHMARIEDLGDIVPDTPQSMDNAIVEPAPKIAVPRGANMTLIGEHKVAYSDIDINQHANNTKYIAWAMDALPLDEVSSREISDVYINFNREALPGETVSLYSIPAAADTEGGNGSTGSGSAGGHAGTADGGGNEIATGEARRMPPSGDSLPGGTAPVGIGAGAQSDSLPARPAGYIVEGRAEGAQVFICKIIFKV